MFEINWNIKKKYNCNVFEEKQGVRGKAKGKKTIVELLHEDVPEKSVNSITDGWNAYYLGAIQEMFDEANP